MKIKISDMGENVMNEYSLHCMGIHFTRKYIKIYFKEKNPDIKKNWENCFELSKPQTVKFYRINCQS